MTLKSSSHLASSRAISRAASWAPALVLCFAAACTNSVTAEPSHKVITESQKTECFCPKAGSVADIASAVIPGVVNIASEKRPERQSFGGHPFYRDPFFKRFFGPGKLPQMPKQRGEGSGVIVSGEGIILTNHHVIEGADDIEVTLWDGRKRPARLVGSDARTDVAVLELEDPPEDLSPLGFGDPDELRIGDEVLAVGNPFGVGQTVTRGIVSAKGRADIGITDYEDFIQTDAAINPGNSGGALVNMRGELVGINTAILSRSGGNQGIGFAIPSTMARGVMDDLIEHGRVRRGLLGIHIQDLDQGMVEAMGLDTHKGALVSDVEPGSPADRAGVEVGDVILRFDGQPVEHSARLRNLVSERDPGSKAPIELRRGDKALTVTATLGEVPEDTRGRSAVSSNPGESDTIEGLHLSALSEATRGRFDIESSVGRGVVVTDIERDSPARWSGLQIGDVIVEINREPVDTPAAAHKLLKHKDKQQLLRIHRRGAMLFMSWKLP